MKQKTLFSKRYHQDAVGRGHTHAHDGTHQCWHAQRGSCCKEEQHDAGQRSRQRRDDDERVKPRLEVNHDQQVDQHNGEGQTGEQAHVRGLHGLNLPADAHERATGQRFFVGRYDSVDLFAHRTQVPVLHRTIDIERSADIVVIDDLHLGASADVCHIRQNLGLFCGRRRQRNILQVVQRLDVVLWCLGNDAVSCAVLVVKKEQRRELRASAEQVLQTAADVPQRIAALRCLGAVHIHCEYRVVVGLLNAQVHEAGDMSKLVEHGIGDLTVGGDVGALELHVYRRGQAKVENLGYDVRRQKIEGHTGKVPRQVLTQLRYIVLGGAAVFPLQRDKDIRVARADQAGGGMLQIQCAVRQANVVEYVIHVVGRNGLADILFDQIAELCGLFNACTGLGAQMQEERAGVAAGEEVLT